MPKTKNRLKESIEDKFYKIIIRKKEGIGDVDSLCRNTFNCSFKDIVTMDLQNIKLMVEDIDAGKYPGCTNSFKNIGKWGNYVVDVIYRRISFPARELIYNNSNTKVCPYCNRNYIDIVKTNHVGKKIQSTTFDLDHFFPKSQYPMLAISFYNLIPACPACNRIKHDKIALYHPLDLQEDYFDMFNFSYEAIGDTLLSDIDDISIFIEGFDKNIDDLQKKYMEKLYSSHKDIAREIILKAKYYNPTYINEIFRLFPDLGDEVIDAYRFYFGNYLKRKDWSKRSLAKFTYDIAKKVLEEYGIDVEKI